MLAIFDMSSVNIRRYNYEFLKRNSEKYIAYIDEPELDTELDDYAITIIYSTGWSIKKLMQSFKLHNVSTLIISGQRPADIRMVIAANKLNISVIYKMHGLYVEHVKRSFIFYCSHIKKVFRTVLYLLDISISVGKMRVSYGIFFSFLFGGTRKNWMNSDILKVNRGLVWSNYWIAWHENNWGMKPRNGWGITGNPDTTKFTKTPVGDSSVCYIYQTLVEDGKVSSVVMNAFYDNLLEIARKQEKVVYVKWHARGEISIRNELERRGFIISDDLAVGGVYIGHSSSLLGLVPVIGGVLIVFELEGLGVPEAISKCATLVTNKVDCLAKGISVEYSFDNIKKSNAIYYFGGNYSYDSELSAIYCQHPPKATPSEK